MNGERKRTSPWVYIGIGCGGVLLLALLAAVALGVMGYRKAKQMEAEMKDPAARAAKVREVLGGEIPDGYYPMVALSVPFIMEMAMLGDQPPDQHGRPANLTRGFVYVKVISTGQQQDELKSYFEGKTDDVEALRRSNIHVKSGAIVKRGALDLPGQSTLYVAQRGDFKMEQNKVKGLTTLVYVDCPQDERQRLGIWFGPDPAPEKPVAEVDWSGTQADEAVIREFIGHFRLCGK